MVFRLSLLIAMAALAGCAGNGASDQPHQPKANAEWRRSLGDASFVQLAAGETLQLKITPDAQTFGFPEGISYFVGLALAPTGAPRTLTLTLRTLPVYSFWRNRTHVFVPRVAIVAPDGKVSRYVAPGFEPSTEWVIRRLLPRDTGWKGSVTLAAGESRLAIYTATLLPQTLRLPEAGQSGGYWYVPSGPTGVIEVTLNAN